MSGTDGKGQEVGSVRRTVEIVVTYPRSRYHILSHTFALGSSSRGCDPRRVGMFKNAEEEPMPQMIKPVAWEAVKELLIAEVRRLS